MLSLDNIKQKELSSVGVNQDTPRGGPTRSVPNGIELNLDQRSADRQHPANVPTVASGLENLGGQQETRRRMRTIRR